MSPPPKPPAVKSGPPSSLGAPSSPLPVSLQQARGNGAQLIPESAETLKPTLQSLVDGTHRETSAVVSSSLPVHDAGPVGPGRAALAGRIDARSLESLAALASMLDAPAGLESLTLDTLPQRSGKAGQPMPARAQPDGTPSLAAAGRASALTQSDTARALEAMKALVSSFDTVRKHAACELLVVYADNRSNFDGAAGR